VAIDKSLRQSWIDSLRQSWIDVNPAGKHRPILDSQPVPWIGGRYPAEGAWAQIDENRAQEAAEQKLCIVCGLDLGADYVYANFDGEPHDHPDRRIEFDPDTASMDELTALIFGLLQVEAVGAPSPTFVHPRCALQAAAFCPHLKAQEYPAIAADGTMLTAEDLRKLSNVHDNDNDND